MTTEADVPAVCDQLVQLVEILMNPVVPQSQRIEAFHRSEQFKETSPICVQCGFFLSRPNQSPVIRHFGLKLLEDVIKARWNDMSPEQKLFIKENVMQLIQTGTNDILIESNHVKDGISRLVVEIAKREWPQHWPSFLPELNDLAQKGETQAEMIMFVILRLVEDVAVLQTLEQNQRRKEIYQALTSNLTEIFAFLFQFLEKHYQSYLDARQLGATNEVALKNQKRHCKVCQAVLSTFNAFVEWVPMSHIMSKDKFLIRCLCHLLSDDMLRLNAAECLLSIVTWKLGKVAERAQLLTLFNTDMIAPLFTATETAAQNSLNEENYLFLKRMVQILVELGGQLTACWTKDKRPENFEIYLNAMIAFTSHPSQTVNHLANELWAKFFRHADISQDPVFQTYIPKWIECALKKSLRIGHPTATNHPSCSYSALDFETDEEFLGFFGRYRLVMMEIVKLISARAPQLPFQFCETWLKSVLARPITEPVKTESEIYVEIDAIANILDALFMKLSKEQLQTNGLVTPALNLLKICIDYNAQDGVLTSVILSCISAMFGVATLNQDAMLSILTKIFSCITFRGDNVSTDNLPNSVKMLRRHGCALLIKIGSRYPRALLPMFSHLRDTVVNLNLQGQVAKMEFASLVEALVLISNEYKSFDAQSQFINSISEAVCQQFRNLESVIADPVSFMDFIGLTKSSQVAITVPFSTNRSELAFCLTFLLSVCRRATVPSDIKECRAGGFVINEYNGMVTLRNPAGEVGCAILRHVLMFAKTMNGLWAPEVKNRLSSDYEKALEMLDAEKNNVVGISNRDPPPKTPLTKMQTFLYETYENNYHFMSQYCTSMSQEFYNQPQLAEAIVASVFQGTPHIPDFRLRAINRMFVKSLINKCPKQQFAKILIPVLESLFPYMLNRLGDRWKYLQTIRESPNFDEDNTDSQEVIDDVICRQLAREYLDVVKASLTSGGGSEIASADENENNNADRPSPPTNVLALSDLGQMVLQHESLGQCVILTILRALVWPDSPSSQRACTLLELILPTLVNSGQLNQTDASHIMYSVLAAIHELGQHELNYIALVQLAIQAYEYLRPKYPGILDVLAQVPGCNQDDLRRFDEHMQTTKNGPVKGGERAKKDMFKKLINQFIGKDVAQMFKKEVVIKNLPTLQMLKPKVKTPSLEETEKHDIGLCSLFAQNGNSKG